MSSAPPWDFLVQPPDIAVLVVLKEEFVELERTLGASWFARSNPTLGGYDYFWVDPASGYRCVATFGGRMSPEEATHYADRLLEWEPATIVNIGIAAGLHGDVRIGDVVVPDLVVAYDKTSKVRPKSTPEGGEASEGWEIDRRSDAFRATHELVEEAKNLEYAHRDAFRRWLERGRADFQAIQRRNPEGIDALLGRRNSVLCAEPTILVETLASGHAVVAAEAFAAWIRSGNADIKALEMEAAGVLLAAEKRVGAVAKLVIRGISDHSAVAKAQTEAIESGALRGLAMRNALRTFELLMELGLFPRAEVRGDAALNEEIIALRAELERRTASGEDVTELREAILGARRLMRDGLSLRVGDVFATRYRLDMLAGTGGFATVWKAWDNVDKTMVAVKVLHHQWTADRSRVERFFSGARQMAKLQHPGIARVLCEHGEYEQHFFFVMPWMAGGDLFRAIKDDKLASHDALRALARVADALSHAHARSVIHRDVKPHNILLDGSGNAVLADFDLVHAFDTTHGTKTGGMGTYIYAAPEQLEDASAIDARVDVYGLGMTALYCLLRRNPPAMVSDRKPQVLQRLDCSEVLARSIRRAVACEPDERAEGCSELAEALREPEPSTRHKWPWLVGAGGVVAVALGTFAFLEQFLDDAETAGEPIAESPQMIQSRSTKPDPLEGLVPIPPSMSDDTSSVHFSKPTCPSGEFCEGGLCFAGDCIKSADLGMVRIGGGQLEGVMISKFWLDETEVTVAAYRQCVEAKQCNARSDGFLSDSAFPDRECNGGRIDHDQHPMNCIDWSDADAYCKWRGSELPKLPGWVWTLPPELHWEWAAAGGRSPMPRYPFEGEPNADVVNACGIECVEWRKLTEGRVSATLVPMYDEGDLWKTTAPVGSKPAGNSKDGVADLAGNVWEWTNTRGAKDQARVIRGGSWRNEQSKYLTLAQGRGEVRDDHRNAFTGFRCALVSEGHM